MEQICYNECNVTRNCEKLEGGMQPDRFTFKNYFALRQGSDTCGAPGFRAVAADTSACFDRDAIEEIEQCKRH